MVVNSPGDKLQQSHTKQSMFAAAQQSMNNSQVSGFNVSNAPPDISMEEEGMPNQTRKKPQQ